MGRIYKKFTAENALGKAGATGQIDSGADITLVSLSIGRKLGLDPATSPTIAIGGIGRQRVVGFEVPVRLRIGRSSANLKVAVPVGTFDDKRGKLVLNAQKRNLIGHDFLQATKSRIDFSKPHSQAFTEGAVGPEVNEVVRLKITAAEVKALRALATKAKAKRKSRGTR